MSIIEMLKENKGTVLTALSKQFANQVLNGNQDILNEAIQLVSYDLKNEDAKNVRAGAAKIIELVAEKNPELVSLHLDDMMPSLTVKEPQTKWMIIMTFGYCARQNPGTAFKGIPFAKQFINEHQGVCLSGAAEMYLGYIGELSSKNAELVLPILIEAYDKSLPNEVDWIFEAFIKIFKKLPQKERQIVLDCANEYLNSCKPATRKRAQKIVKLNIT